ncbi:hypothetical protein AMK16_20285 [Streptomyces sp. CB00455]|uniref:STAS domain-containing protein n=1 Tax=Streptomyces sp. CB00455 TaxID=1703927 RepID=UPI00093E8630|nr:STAS domain-containing protein [Streptomyces sp. CB00455]OKK17231.1 hypothetical protein AMK16_20285 [Streptomyces sp. CB00455]
MHGHEEEQNTGGARPSASGAEATVVRVMGDIDMDRTDELRSMLMEAVADDGSGPVVVDVSGLTFCDSTGLSVLLRARMAAEEAGRAMCLAGPTQQLVRLLEVTGAGALLPVVPVPEPAPEAG